LRFQAVMLWLESRDWNWQGEFPPECGMLVKLVQGKTQRHVAFPKWKGLRGRSNGQVWTHILGMSSNCQLYPLKKHKVNDISWTQA
jgi:hypothetical protein